MVRFSDLRRAYKRSPWLRRASRSLKNSGIYWLVRAALAGLRALPFDAALRLAAGAGGLAYYLMPAVRRLSDEHLRVAFGDTLTAAARGRIARRALMNAGRCFGEIARLDEIAERFDTYIELTGTDTVEAVRRAGRGAIVITGHLGNWEILAAYFARQGLPVTAVARRLYEDRINTMLVEMRSRHGVRSILREDASSARQILQTLNSGGILAMVIDQDTSAPSVSVPFFGRLARTPVAPATLALRRDIPLLAAFIERRAEGGHRIIVHRPFSLPAAGGKLERTRRLVADMSAALESEVRRRPEEWVWWHKRWHRGPIPSLDMDHRLETALAP